MNRGFGEYFGQGVKVSAKTIYKNKNFLKYYLWLLMNLFGRIFFFAPLFQLASVRFARTVASKQKADITGSFNNAGEPKAVWTAFVTFGLKIFMLIGGAFVVLLATSMLGGIGYAIALLGKLPLYVTIIFAAPGAIALAVYLIIAPLFLAPTSYVTESNPGISVGDALAVGVYTMRHSGKGTHFLNRFVPSIILLGYLLFAALVCFLASNFIAGYAGFAVTIVLAVLFLAGFICVLPIFALAGSLSDLWLYEDIVIDPNAKKCTKGIIITDCDIDKFRSGTVESNLAGLFDAAEDVNSELIKNIKATTPSDGDITPAVENPKKIIDLLERAKAMEKGKTETPDTAEGSADPAPEVINLGTAESADGFGEEEFFAAPQTAVDEQPFAPEVINLGTAEDDDDDDEYQEDDTDEDEEL